MKASAVFGSALVMCSELQSLDESTKDRTDLSRIVCVFTSYKYSGIINLGIYCVLTK